MRADGFDWDEGNRSKCGKHGVTIAEIEGLFTGVVRIVLDATHSAAETRYKAIGVTPHGRRVFLIFALREREGRRLIRRISARYMHAREVEYHEEVARPEER